MNMREKEPELYNEIELIIKKLFNTLEEEKFLQKIINLDHLLELDQYNKFANRATLSFDLLHKLTQIQKNQKRVLVDSFNQDDEILITCNLIVFCLLDRYEVIPRLFKFPATEKFLKWYDKKLYKKTGNCNFTLGKLFHKFTKLGCTGCGNIVNSQLRNIIAHGNYWWGPIYGRQHLMFYEKSSIRIIQQEELMNQFNRVSIIPQVIMEEFKNRDFIE